MQVEEEEETEKRERERGEKKAPLLYHVILMMIY